MIYRYFIKISFDGTHYSGWQVQKNSANTIQQKLNEGLSKLLSEKIEVYGCCRTDAGVHAKGLYAHFDTQKNLSMPVVPLSASRSTLDLPAKKREGVETWLHKFNSMIPADISIDDIFSVQQDTNARFDATARTYQYVIHNKRSPFLINRAYYYYGELDIALMNKAAAILKKYEDFSSFSKVNTQVKTNKCKIYKAVWEKLAPPLKGEGKGSLIPLSLGQQGMCLIFTIRANRFLRGMVRMIVGTMLLVGKHKITLADFQDIIDSKDCRNAGALVPACGLYLTKVEYPQKVFIQDLKNKHKHT